MWWWRKVRKAQISQAVQDECERFGEQIISFALAGAPENAQPALRGMLHDRSRDETIAWLTEQRDRAERARQRTETVEIAILIFVAVETVLTLISFF